MQTKTKILILIYDLDDIFHSHASQSCIYHVNSILELNTRTKGYFQINNMNIGGQISKKAY